MIGFAIGLIVGAVAGATCMCLVSYKREMEHEQISLAIERHRMKGAQNHID
jgi:hypothetical protein